MCCDGVASGVTIVPEVLALIDIYVNLSQAGLHKS